MAKQVYEIDCGKIAGLFDGPSGKIVLGPDGFIDEVWQIVFSRSSREKYLLYEKMSDFSKAFASCSEGGFSNEIVRKRRSYGGFTANTSKAIIRLGICPTLIGMFGKDRVDPAFAEFAESSNLFSTGEPGISQVYEFADGKLMLVYIQEVMGFNWLSLTEAVSEEELGKIFVDADVIALGYWSLVPAFDEIVTKVCGLCGSGIGDKRMFFDFADIRKKDKQSLENTLGMLAKLGEQIPMTLSLNENEAELLFSYYGESLTEEAGEAGAQTEKIRNIIGLDELIVHTPYLAAAASAQEGCCALPQHYCTSPVITAGAGDNFNGGYLSALLKGLPMVERLMVANATTYQYVSLGHSPNKEEMLAELSENAVINVY